MCAQPLDELFSGHAGPWTEQEWATLPEATIFDPDHVALVVEVTSPSDAWAERLVKPDAYARAGIPHYLRVDLDRGWRELGATGYSLISGGFAETSQANGGRLVLDQPFRAELDLAALTTATRYPGQS
ncbi:MAG: Uma2 family endonuclease [Pseudonocardiaceae bacterium]